MSFCSGLKVDIQTCLGTKEHQGVPRQAGGEGATHTEVQVPVTYLQVPKYFVGSEKTSGLCCFDTTFQGPSFLYAYLSIQHFRQ